MFLPHPRVKVSIVGSLRDREVACSASDRQGSNFESCVWRTVSSQSSHHPQEVLLARFSLYVHKGGLKPDSFHLTSCERLVFAGIFLIARLRHSGLTLPSVSPEDVGSLPPQVDKLQRNEAVSTPSTRGYYVEPQWAIGYEMGLMPPGFDICFKESVI